jgi:perosamine synthetase
MNTKPTSIPPLFQEQNVTNSLPVRSEYLAFGRPDFTEREIDAVTRVMRSGWIGQGNETLAFEGELQAAVGARHAITVSSCTAALFLALKALGIRDGDEVIVPSLTWCSTANAALYVGATPVFADIDPNSLCVTTESVMAQVTPKTKAVIPVHLGGLTVDVAGLRAALPPGVAIVEDAAHALGATFPNGAPVGSSGNITCFSFYANKNLSTAEGGAVALADDTLASAIKSLRLHALPADAWRRFTNPSVTFDGGISELGYKMNFTDLQAAIGRVQLARFVEMQVRRHNVANVYVQRLASSGLVDFQSDVLSAGHARHLMLIVLRNSTLQRSGLNRNSLLHSLRKANVGVSVHYHPLHAMPLYRPYMRGNLATTDDIAARVLTLPIGAAMSEDDAHYVCDHFLALLAQ